MTRFYVPNHDFHDKRKLKKARKQETLKARWIKTDYGFIFDTVKKRVRMVEQPDGTLKQIIDRWE